VAAQADRQPQARRAEAGDPEEHDARSHDMQGVGDPAAADDAGRGRQAERERGRSRDGEPGEVALGARGQLRRAWRRRAWERTRPRNTGLPTR
jgi:hypothetical protein